MLSRRATPQPKWRSGSGWKASWWSFTKGLRARSIFWSGETWVDENPCARFSPQNDRMYYHKSTQKDSVSEELKKPLKQRTPGVMVHITVCSANGGLLLKPHPLPENQTMAADYYCNMLESDVFPQIEGVLPEGERLWRQHDLASAHTALQTKQFLATKNITTLPWLPSGADLSPLDIYVSPELKRRLKGKDLSTG